MKRIMKWIPMLGSVWLCGCFQVEDDLTLQPDGSGTVRLTVRTSVPEEMQGIFAAQSGGGPVMYPPINQAEAQQFFPRKDFTLKVDAKPADSGKTVTIEAAFKDVNALLASPYGRAHQLALKVQPDGRLKLLALSGCEGMARAAQIKPEGEMAQIQVPGLEEAQKKKGEMRDQFRVTLPNEISQANGARAGKTVTWTAERAKCKDDEEFTAKLAGVLEASCPAQGVKFSPQTPPRLGLAPFAQLAAGRAGAAVAIPDTNKVAAAARFIPCALQVTRAVDLAGEGGPRQSQAQLIGLISLPAELAPQRWGEVKLEEVVDAKGNNLAPKDKEESNIHRFSSYESSVGSEGDEEDAEETGEAAQPKEKSGLKERMVTVEFKAPDWKVKEIARIKGAMELQYLGASEVIKLTNAVPAKLVRSMSANFSAMNFDGNAGQVNDPRLTELGFTVRVPMAMTQSGMTTLSLQTGGAKSSVVELQVFDAEGRPWPTLFAPPDASGGEEQTSQVMIPGMPKPPFSLALLVAGVGASVEVPILVEKAPTR